MREDRRGTERLAELFEHALALPQEDRRRYTCDACRDDPDLCSELVSLLTAYEEAPSYFARFAPQLRQAALTPTESRAPSANSDRGSENEVGLRVGQRFGHYEIGRLLGRGGMSEAWEAEDLDTGRHVALKMLGWRLRSAADRARFLREGHLTARVNQPNVVYVFGTEEIEGVPVIAMELASGGTLEDLVTADGPMRPARAVDVMLQVIAGLEAAAGAGVLHRDIKPSNCFIDGEGRIQVGDFGIAAATTVQPEATLTRTGGLLCTPTFASPEQLRGAPLDVRSDIYAVGATLYYLLTGRPPLDAANGVQLIERVQHERPAAVRAVRRDVPRPLDRIVQRCLAKDPAERPPSYADLSKSLLPYGSASPAPAPLGLRTLAFVIDGMIMRFLGGVLPFLILMQWRQQVLASALEWLAFLGAHSLLLVAYFGVSEAIWSASPGKMVVGLRVIRTGGQPLGLGRSLARAFLWWLALAPALIGWIAWWPSGLGAAAWSTGWPVYLAMGGVGAGAIGILFATARRPNGFAGLHDLATKTRVVSKLTFEPGAVRMLVEPPPVLPHRPTRLGPYVMLDEPAPSGIVIGFDRQLGRRVWIRRVPPGTRSVSLARRNVTRPTRLRWLTGGRGTDGGWDAYEAATGAQLRRSERPRSWAIVRGWLQDLAQEIAAAREDGTCLPLDLERVWVADGRARLLDWLPEQVEGVSVVPEFVNSPDEHQVQRFLSDAAMLGLRLQGPGLNRASDMATLPLHARELLDDLAADRFDATTAIVERLRSLATKPVTLTPRRRSVHLAICAAAPLVGILIMAPVVALLLPLLARSPDALLLDACLRRLAQLERSSSVEATRERTALETYVVGRFRPLVTESIFRKPWFWPLIEIRQSTIERALARQPDPSAVEIERAAGQLAELRDRAQRNRELAARGLLGWRLMLFVVLLLMVASAVAALLSAFVTRGGAVLRLLGIAVVAQDGREVSRLRGLARAVIAWAPGIAALVLILPFAVRGAIEDVPVGQLTPCLVLLALFVAGSVFALFNVNQGLQDRIVRTSLVTR
jgi:uncharacterized RDD family membrane protein YckC